MATFRQDGAYKDGRRPDSVRFATAEEDAQRRDFTINGLFYDPVAEQLIDYVGGEADLRAGIIRAIGNPADRFAEDHLRLLRAIRFAARLNFKIEPKTWEAIRAAAPPIRTVSAERIRDELNQIFTAPKPELGLDLLDQSGLLAEVLPDIAALHGVEQPPQFHPEGDVFEHVRLMLTKIEEPNLDLALGVLFHDVGKKPTSKVDENGRIRFNEHESVGAEMAEQIMTGLRYDNKTHPDGARAGAAPHAVQGRAAHARQHAQADDGAADFPAGAGAAPHRLRQLARRPEALRLSQAPARDDERRRRSIRRRSSPGTT